MPVVQNQRRFVFKRIGFEFVRHFSKRVFNERSLQLRFFALCPRTQNRFAKPNPRAILIRDDFITNRLSKLPQLIKTLWPPAAVDSRSPVTKGFPTARFCFLGSMFFLPLKKIIR
jgi:hypothetical protein